MVIKAQYQNYALSSKLYLILNYLSKNSKKNKIFRSVTLA